MSIDGVGTHIKGWFIPELFIPPLQRLTSQAFYYFETIAKLVNSNPAAYSITFVRQLAAFIDRLKPHDSREQAGGLNERDMLWVRVLNANAEKLEVCSALFAVSSSHLTYSIQIGSILPSSTSCARTTSLSDVTSSVTDTQHPDDDDDDDDVDDVSDVSNCVIIVHCSVIVIPRI